jgi:hypothetical protein
MAERFMAGQIQASDILSAMRLMLIQLDACGQSIAAIHLQQAIETLEAEKLP